VLLAMTKHMSDLKKYIDYKTILSVNALIWSGSKVLLLKRAATKKVDPGVYSGIGGKVEPGEDFYSAILREIEEETGIKEVKDLKPYSITQHPFPPTDAEWVNLYFTCTIPEQINLPNTEDGQFHWIDPSGIDKLKIVEDLKRYIKILQHTPSAFIFGYFYYSEGERPEPKIILTN
jgi:8-oxo-dGTP pyrophosphatase MutT (NUDIX family)